MSADGDMKSRKKERKPTGELLSGMWQELKLATKPLKEDDLSEAVDLLATLHAQRLALALAFGGTAGAGGGGGWRRARAMR